MFRKIRFYYLLILAVIKREWRKSAFVLVSLFLVSLFTFTFAPLIHSQVERTSSKFVKPVFIEAVVGNPQTFNPLFSTTEVEKEINALVFRGLMKVSKDGVLVPDLAENFQIKSPTEYEFKLKQDVFWHDGEKFTADDVIHTITTAQDPVYKSEIESNFREVGVEKVDDYTVVFHLKEPFAPFLTATTVGIIPEHIPLNRYKPVGTGVFKFTAIKDGEITLEGERNKIEFKFYPTIDTALTALKLGEAHGIGGVITSEKSLNGWGNFKKVEKTLPFRLVTAFFNLREDIFAEKGVRQALAYALPKDEIIKSNDGIKGSVAMNSFSLLDQIQKSVKEKYSYNIKKAEENLNENGWKLKSDGKRYNGDKKLEFSITTVEDPEFEDTALKLKSAWEKIGAEVSVNVVSGLELKNQIVPNRAFAVLLTSQLLNPDPDQYVLWHTTQADNANISGIASPKLDKLLEDGRKSTDQKVRKEKYQEFARILLDESPAIFLYYPEYVWTYSNRVESVDLGSFQEPEDRFDSADNWVIKKPLW